MTTSTVKNRITKRTVLIYTGLFLLLIIGIYGLAFANGSSFIWDSDGYHQHFPLFIEYVDKLKTFLAGEGFSLWDWTIGPGADVITSYGYYVVGDPFVYLGVLFPAALNEFAYHFLIFLRMWFVGGSFLLYARRMKISNQAGLLGGLMYAFSHYAVYNVIRHPFFILPMIWFPVLCLGVEKLLHKESGVLFSLAVAISAISNFYFFYKLTILVFIYGVVRYGFIYGYRKNIRHMLKLFLRCLFYYFIGVLISAVIFLPMVLGFLTGSRTATSPPINLFIYTLEYYFLLIHNAFIPGTYFWTVGGLSVFAIFALVFLFRRPKKQAYVRIILVILGIFLLFPFFGSMMNGFSTPYNRFTFVLPFFIALASAYLLENRRKLDSKDFKISKYILIGFTILYLIALVVTQMILLYLTPILIGWGMWLLLKKDQTRRLSFESVSKLLIALITINLAANAINFYYPHGKNALSSALALGETEESYSEIFGGLEEYLPESELYRVGVTSQDNHVRNHYMYHDLMGVNSYLSITNSSLADFSEELELSSYQVIQPLRNGLDDRRILNYLFGIEYIMTEQDNENYIPENYEVIHETQDDPSFVMSQTDNHYPLAYAENTWLSYSVFTQLNPVEKEYYLSQGLVLNREPQLNLEYYEGDFPVQTISPQVVETDSTVNMLEDGSFEVTEDDSQVRLTLNSPESLAGHEIYVHLQGLDFELLDDYPLIRQNTEYRIRLFYENREKSVLQSDIYQLSSYFYRENMLFNMGSTEEGEEELVIQFDNAGRYDIDDIQVYALPVNEAESSEVASNRRENALNITTFEDEKIIGDIYQNNESILTTSIPYTNGWSAQVNGQPVDTIKTNVGFIGIPLETGDSEVEFTYETPGLKAGAVITFFGAVILGITQYLYGKNKSDD